MTKNTQQNMSERFVEKGADIEHNRWARWQKWCNEVLREYCPSPELEKVLERWDKQIATSYAELSEEDKEKDRKQTRAYLPLLHQEIKAFAEALSLEGNKKVFKLNEAHGACKGNNLSTWCYQCKRNKDFVKNYNLAISDAIQALATKKQKLLAQWGIE